MGSTVRLVVCVLSIRCFSGQPTYNMASAEACVAKIKELVRIFTSKDGFGQVATADLILAELEKEKLCWEERIPVARVGVSPVNRDGLGVNAEDVHALGGDLFAMGWSWEAAGSVVCVEEAPGRDYIARFDDSVVAGNPKLPESEPDTIRYGSIAGSHRNMFLRCLLASAESGEEAMCEGGRLCLEKVARADANFANAARHGLTWKVLSYKVEVDYPEVLPIIMRARNAPNSAARAEHEVQVLLRLHAMAVQAQKSGQSPDWPSIRRCIGRGRPRCIDYLEELSLFVALYSGGVDGVFLKDLASFHGQFVDSKKTIIFGEFWRALAEWDVQTPLLKIALLKMQYVSSKVNKYKEPTLVLGSDLTKMAKKKQDLLDSEKLLCELRATFKEAGLDGLPLNVRTKILGQLDCMVARFTCGKQHQSAVRLESIAHAKRQVLEAALKLEAWSDLAVLRTALAECASEPTQVTSGVGSTVPLQEYRDGQLVDTLATVRAAGFDGGSMVVKKGGSSNQTYEILDAKSGFVHVREGGSSNQTLHPRSEDSTEVKVPVGEFLKEYEMMDKQVAAPHPGWPIDYMCTKEYIVHVAKLRIMSALHAAAASTSDAVDNIVVLEKPKRTVVAKHALALSTLMLVPNVLRISTQEAAERPGADSGQVSVDIPASWKMPCLRDVRFALVPFFSKEMPCPAWAVRTTDKADMANMEWRLMVVNEVAVAEGPKQFTRATAACTKFKVSTKSAPDATVQQQAPGKEHELRVPVMINVKAIQEEGELLLYRAPKRKIVGPPASVKVAKLMKDNAK